MQHRVRHDVRAWRARPPTDRSGEVADGAGAHASEPSVRDAASAPHRCDGKVVGVLWAGLEVKPQIECLGKVRVRLHSLKTV